MSGAAGGVCVVAGVGPGTGRACVERFARGGYRTAMLARDTERLELLAREIPNSRAFACDVCDPASVKAAFDALRAELGPVDVLIYNAAAGSFQPFMELEPAVLEQNFRTNTMGLLHCGKIAATDMLERGAGAIVITGNTAARRGVPRYAGFAPTKAAQRILGESMARDLGPKGVHVSYLVIDAVISVPWTRERWPDLPDEYFAMPADIAETVWHLAHQPKSAWSFETEVRPFGEKW